MAHCPSPADLRDYALGNLVDDRFDQVEQHIDTCELCLTTLETLDLDGDEVLQALRHVPAENTQLHDSGWKDVEDLVKAIGVEWSQADNAPVIASLLPQQRLRDYDLLEKLGQGGMGTVYKAVHSRLKKVVALKVLPADRMENAESVRRFEREMQAVGGLNHPHIVQATDAGEVEGTHFLVMEYVDGLNLSQLVDHCGPLRVADACELVRQAALGLQHAHENGMVHRDIKPSNLMLSSSGEIKILDLGLALLSEGPAGGGELTTTNQIMGTLDYMAPEQATDTHTVDIRADLYSLGATLYKLLAGRAPLHVDGGAAPVKKLNLLLNTQPEPIRTLRPDVPEPLGDLLERLLAKTADTRPATPADLIAKLEPFTSGADLQKLASEAKDGAFAIRRIPLATASSIDVSSHLIETATQTPMAEAESASQSTLLQAVDKPPRRPRRRTGLVMAGLLAVLLGGLITVVTKQGTVTIETPERLTDAVTVKITPLAGGDKAVAILDKQSTWTATVAGGEYTLELVGGDDEFDLQDQTLTVSRFGTTLVRITHASGKVAKASGSAPLTPVPRDHLFDAAPMVDPKTLRTRREIAEWYQSVGGGMTLFVDNARTWTYVKPSTPLPAEPFEMTSIRLAWNDQLPPEFLAPITHIPELKSLALIGTNVRAEDLAPIETCENLEILDLTGAPAGDAALETVGRCRSLRILLLSDMNITESGLAKISSLPLTHLQVGGTRLDQQGLAQIAKIRTLESLNLARNELSLLDLTVLKNHANLSHLEVHASSFGDDDIAELLQIPSLRKINLHTTHVTHRGLRELAAHQGLRELILSNQQRSGEDVAALKLFERLEVLELDGTSLLKESIDELHQALPYCRIVWDGGVIEPSQVRAYALQFDGQDDHVTLPITWDGSHPLTVEMWATPARGPAEGNSSFIAACVGPLVIKNWGPTRRWQGMAWEGVDDGFLVAAEDLQRDSLTHRAHLAVVWDGEDLRFYLDGKACPDRRVPGQHYQQLPKSEQQKLRDIFARAALQKSLLGAFYDGDSRIRGFFAGTIDEVRISNSDRYTEDFTPAESFEGDHQTLALYHFDEGAGDVLRDASGNGHDGTIAGASWVDLSAVEHERHERSVRERELAAKLLDHNVTLGLSLSGSSEPQIVKPGAELPAGDFEISYADIRQVAFLEEVLPLVAQATGIRHLRLDAASITPERLAVLAPLVKVSRLNLNESRQVTNDLLSVVADLFPKLTELHMVGTSLPADGLPALLRMDSLRIVAINHTQNPDVVLQALQDHRRDYLSIEIFGEVFSWRLLQSLIERQAYCIFDARPFVFEHGGRCSLLIDGQDVALTRDGPAPGRPEWRFVSRLDFADTAVTTETFRWLGPQVNPVVYPQQLRLLSLAGTQVTDGVVRYFNHLPHLEDVDFSRTALTDQGIFQLAAAPALRRADLRQTSATAAAIAYLRQLKPDCEFLSDFSDEEIAKAPSLFRTAPDVPTDSPLDQLRREDIDPHELRMAGDGDPANAPAELVAIFGDSRLRQHFIGPNGPHLAFAANSRSLVSAGFDGRIIQWDIETGQMQSLLDAGYPLLSVNRTGEADQFVANGLGGHGIYELPSGRTVEMLPTIGGAFESLSVDSRIGVTGAWDGAGHHCVWHVPQRRLIFDGTYVGRVRQTSVHPSGELFALVGADGAVTVRETRSGKEVCRLADPNNHLQCVIFSQDGNCLYTGGRDQPEIVRWDARTGEVLQRFALSRNHVITLAESPDGRHLVTGHYLGQGTVEMVDLQTGERRWRRSYGRDETCGSLAFSPDGTLVAGAGTYGRIRLWEAESGTEVHSDREHLGRVTATSLSEDGRFLGSVENDGTVLVRDTATGNVVRRWDLSHALSAIAIHSSLGLVCVGETEWPYTLKLLSLRTGELIAQSPSFNARIGRLAFTFDGSALVMRDGIGRVHMLNPLTFRVRQTTEEQRDTGDGGQLCISRDGRAVATLRVRGSVFSVVDMQTGQRVFTSPEAHSRITEMAISPDGKLLVLALSQPDQPFQLWNLETQQRVAEFGSRRGPGDDSTHSISEGFERSASRMTFDPTSERLYTAFDEGEVEIWNLENLGTDPSRTTLQAAGPRDGFYGLHVDPAGRHVITHNGNDTLSVLRLSATTDTGQD
jgi:serine/threonine protein kinase/WD40 repeat protein